MFELVERVLTAAPRCGDVRVVLVDGPSGAGKTTFAAELATALGATVLHVEDVYPGWDGLEAAATTVTEVLDRVAAGGPVCFRGWDWANDRPGAEHDLGKPPVLVVEGVGCGTRASAAHAVLLIWVDAPAAERHRRAMAREGGDAYRPHWARWAAQEDAHFARERTSDRADVVA